MRNLAVRLLCSAALCLFMAAPLLAQPTINRGVDLLQTSLGSPTVVDFSTNPIPGNFFCAGSDPFTGSVALQGAPLTTAPAGVANGVDTIIERLTNGVFSGGIANIDVVVRALALRSTSDIEIDCPDEGATRWRVSACLCGLQKTSKLQAKLDSTCGGGCGKANGELNLSVCLTFTRVDTGQTAGPVSQNIVLDVKDMPWCYNPGTGDKVVGSPFGVDTNCDGKADLTLPGTSNFHPGRTCANQTADCWTQYAHLTHCHPNRSNPSSHLHCVNPICGRTQ